MVVRSVAERTCRREERRLELSFLFSSVVGKALTSLIVIVGSLNMTSRVLCMSKQRFAGDPSINVMCGKDVLDKTPTDWTISFVASRDIGSIGTIKEYNPSNRRSLRLEEMYFAKRVSSVSVFRPHPASLPQSTHAIMCNLSG